MPKELMNEAERYLLANWENARLLEESMESVRKKYKQIVEELIVAVTESCPELECQRCFSDAILG